MNSVPQPNLLVAIFVINLDGSTQRMDNMRRQLDAGGLDFKRVSGVDGRKMAPSSHPEYNQKRAENYMGRPMLGGEIGCYKSHIRAVEAFEASEAKYALILEDDSRILAQTLPIFYALIDWLETPQAPAWSLINLSNSSAKFFSPIRTFSHGAYTHHIGKAHYFPMIATAILWNRQSASEFLAQKGAIFAPVDNFFRYWMTRSDKGLAFDRPIITPSGEDSDIDQTYIAGAPVSRKKSPRNWHYFFSKQARLNADKFRAWRHQRAYWQDNRKNS